MAITQNIRKTVQLASLLAVSALMGCHHDQIAHGEMFNPPGAPTPVSEACEVQAAAGARADGMLYDHHFDGSDLNSLGKDKLNRMVKGTPTSQPVVVYMNMPHDSATARQTAVAAYLKDSGLKESDVQVFEGSNPNLTTPTAYNLSVVYKGANATFDGEGADTGSASGGGASSSGGASAGK